MIGMDIAYQWSLLLLRISASLLVGSTTGALALKYGRVHLKSPVIYVAWCVALFLADVAVPVPSVVANIWENPGCAVADAMLATQSDASKSPLRLLAPDRQLLDAAVILPAFSHIMGILLARRTLMVGLTGLIASGKSTVLREWRSAAGGAAMHCIDADQVARQVVQPGTSGYRAIVRTFGAGVVCKDGQGGSPLDRKALGQLVFGDSEEHRARRRVLEGITHPAIGWEVVKQALWHGSWGGKMVVLDAALLLRTPMLLALCAPVVVVDVPRDLQMKRLMGRDGSSEEQAGARIASQPPREWMRERAGVVVENSGGLQELQKRARGALRTVARARGLAWAGIVVPIETVANEAKSR